MKPLQIVIVKDPLDWPDELMEAVLGEYTLDLSFTWGNPGEEESWTIQVEIVHPLEVRRILKYPDAT